MPLANLLGKSWRVFSSEAPSELTFVICSRLGGAYFKDEDYTRSWHQREGTKLYEELVLICNRNLCEE